MILSDVSPSRISPPLGGEYRHEGTSDSMSSNAPPESTRLGRASSERMGERGGSRRAGRTPRCGECESPAGRLSDRLRDRGAVVASGTGGRSEREWCVLTRAPDSITLSAILDSKAGTGVAGVPTCSQSIVHDSFVQRRRVRRDPRFRRRYAARISGRRPRLSVFGHDRQGHDTGRAVSA